jgi:protein-S-isoprenylcysteine O-methyltransferase Ste14
MDSRTLAAALLEAAWITARIASGLSVLGAIVAMTLVRARVGGGRPAAVRHRRAGALPRVAAMLLAALAGAIVTTLTRTPAGGGLPAAGQAVIAAISMVSSLCGGMFAAWAAAALGANFAIGAVVRADGALVTSGPFALVRHPFYGALALLGIGAALAAGSLAGAVVFLAAYAPAAHWRAALEEQVLAEAWPAAWAEYAARTPRFLPRF